MTRTINTVSHFMGDNMREPPNDELEFHWANFKMAARGLPARIWAIGGLVLVATWLFSPLLFR